MVLCSTDSVSRPSPRRGWTRYWGIGPCSSCRQVGRWMQNASHGAADLSADDFNMGFIFQRSCYCWWFPDEIATVSPNCGEVVIRLTGLLVVGVQEDVQEDGGMIYLQRSLNSSRVFRNFSRCWSVVLFLYSWRLFYNCLKHYKNELLYHIMRNWGFSHGWFLRPCRGRDKNFGAKFH